MHKPWVAGPLELLEHAREHRRGRPGFDYRIAMISADNALEVAIRTWLGLPHRLRDAPGPPRKRLEGAVGFSELLDMLDEFAGERLSGIPVADVEWYHRIRNQLYHEGNGITVEPKHVDAYIQIVSIVIGKLFGIEIKPSPDATTSPFATFVLLWTHLDGGLRSIAGHTLGQQGIGRERWVTDAPLIDIAAALHSNRIIDDELWAEFSFVNSCRNQIAHGQGSGHDAAESVAVLQRAIDKIRMLRV